LSFTISICYHEGAARFWDEDTLGRIMRACIIMHNMIVEDERNEKDYFNYDQMG
jgi:hypothetical protein